MDQILTSPNGLQDASLRVLTGPKETVGKFVGEDATERPHHEGNRLLHRRIKSGGSAFPDSLDDGMLRYVNQRTRVLVCFAQDRGHGLPIMARKKLLKPFRETLENVNICQVRRGFVGSFVLLEPDNGDTCTREDICCLLLDSVENDRAKMSAVEELDPEEVS